MAALLPHPAAAPSQSQRVPSSIRAGEAPTINQAGLPRARIRASRRVADPDETWGIRSREGQFEDARDDFEAGRIVQRRTLIRKAGVCGESNRYRPLRRKVAVSPRSSEDRCVVDVPTRAWTSRSFLARSEQCEIRASISCASDC